MRLMLLLVIVMAVTAAVVRVVPAVMLAPI